MHSIEGADELETAADLETATLVGEPIIDGSTETGAEPASVDPDRTAFLQGLRDIADFLESHPELPLPYLGTGGERTGTPHVLTDYVIGDEPREQLAQITRALASMGGIVHKHADDDDRYSRFLVWRTFGPIALAYQADRNQVCERTVVGTERVEVEVDACPDCGGPLATTEAGVTVCEMDPGHYHARKPGKRVETAERELVEWRCSPLLADPPAHPDLIGETDPVAVKALIDGVEADEEAQRDRLVSQRFAAVQPDLNDCPRDGA